MRKDVIIGKEIRAVMHEKRISPNRLASLIGMSVDTVYKMLYKKSISTSMLHKVSLALEHDFYQLYTRNPLPTEIELHEKIESTEKQFREKAKINEDLSKEVAYLKEVISLMAGKK